MRIASVASVATPPPLPAVCDYRTQVLCVMIDRLCHHASLCVTLASLPFVHAALVARHEAAQAYRTTSASLKAGRPPSRQQKAS